jgi:KaiC/GvpD/RAD55 family RecA-like ATPase
MMASKRPPPDAGSASTDSRESVPETNAPEPAKVTLPFDASNEAAIVAWAFRDAGAREVLVRRLRAVHFQQREHQEAWAVYQEADRRKLAVDLAVVENLGTPDLARYLDELVGLRPNAPKNLTFHVENVLWDHARMASVRGAVPAFLEALRDPKADPSRVQTLARAIVQSVEGHGTAPRFADAAARALDVGTSGTRVSTPFATLNTATRGGLLPKKVIVVGGAPGAGKTGAIAVAVKTFLESGHPVAVVASDEGADAFLIRIGQQTGITRDDLERGDAIARSALHSALHRKPLTVVDPDESAFTVEELAAHVGTRSTTEKPGVLVVDSLQSSLALFAANAVDNKGSDLRARVEAAMRSLRRLAKEHAIIVIVTTELNRGAYRSKNENDRSEDLASFKESSGIEYAADVALVLRNVAGAPDLVDVSIAKNRLGPRTAFRLRSDRDRATYQEVGTPYPANSIDQHVEESKRAARDARAETEIIRVLKKHPGLESKNAIASRATGQRSTVLAALDVLIADGRVIRTGKQFHNAPEEGVTR